MRFAGLYAALAALTFGLLYVTPVGPAQPVTAQRWAGSAPPGTVAHRFFRYVVATDPGIPRRILKAGLPLMSFVEDMESGRNAPASLVSTISRLISGVDPDDPASFIEAQFPSIILAGERPRIGLMRAPATGPAPEVLFRLPASSGERPAPAVVPSARPVIAVYHTHSRESYLPEVGGNRSEPDDAHSEDPNINTTRVGLELVRALQQLGIGAVHSAAAHDAEGKLAAYVRSETTVQSLLRQYPSLRALVDVHRDSKLRPQTTVLIRGRLMAKIMVVLGNDNRDWRKNFDFATEFIAALEALYPGLSSGIYPKPGRFNQHYSPEALLLEIGGVEDNLDECLRSARAAAEALAHVLKTRNAALSD
jgi:stage II sporulation protein P